MKQNIINGVIGIVCVVLSYVAYTTPNTTETIVKEVTKLGSVVSSELPDNNFAYGGVRRWAYGPKLNVATTTLCAVKSPAATSTLVSVGFQVFTGTSTAATIDVGTSTNAYSTTTNLVSAFSLASGATGATGWSSAGGSVQDNVMSPNTYVVVKTAGAGLSGYTYGGKCSVVFQEF